MKPTFDVRPHLYFLEWAKFFRHWQRRWRMRADPRLRLDQEGSVRFGDFETTDPVGKQIMGMREPGRRQNLENK